MHYFNETKINQSLSYFAINYINVLNMFFAHVQCSFQSLLLIFNALFRDIETYNVTSLCHPTFYLILCLCMRSGFLHLRQRELKHLCLLPLRLPFAAPSFLPSLTLIHQHSPVVPRNHSRSSGLICQSDAMSRFRWVFLCFILTDESESVTRPLGDSGRHREDPPLRQNNQTSDHIFKQREFWGVWDPLRGDHSESSNRSWSLSDWWWHCEDTYWGLKKGKVRQRKAN